MLQLNVRPEILTHNHCGKSCLGQWQRLNGPYHRGRWCMYIALQVSVVLQQLLLPTSTGFMAWMWVSDFTPVHAICKMSLFCSLYRALFMWLILSLYVLSICEILMVQMWLLKCQMHVLASLGEAVYIIVSMSENLESLAVYQSGL
jgi:hypothetical protein